MAGFIKNLVLVGAIAQHFHGDVWVRTKDLKNVFYRKNFIVMAHTTLFRSEEHTSELQSLMRISYAVFCLKKKKQQTPSIQYSEKLIIIIITKPYTMVYM